MTPRKPDLVIAGQPLYLCVCRHRRASVMLGLDGSDWLATCAVCLPGLQRMGRGYEARMIAGTCPACCGCGLSSRGNPCHPCAGTGLRGLAVPQSWGSDTHFCSVCPEDLRGAKERWASARLLDARGCPIGYACPRHASGLYIPLGECMSCGRAMRDSHLDVCEACVIVDDGLAQEVQHANLAA